MERFESTRPRIPIRDRDYQGDGGWYWLKEDAKNTTRSAQDAYTDLLESVFLYNDLNQSEKCVGGIRDTFRTFVQAYILEQGHLPEKQRTLLYRQTIVAVDRLLAGHGIFVDVPRYHTALFHDRLEDAFATEPEEPILQLPNSANLTQPQTDKCMHCSSDCL